MCALGMLARSLLLPTVTPKGAAGIEENGPKNDMRNDYESKKPAHISFRSVFEVDGSRLAIGTFNRPLLDEEARRLQRAWERSPVEGVMDFEVSKKQVSFLTPPPKVESLWKSIDAMLAATTDLAKAS